MSQFKEVKGAYAITRSRSGLFRELVIYTYKKELYAKSGSGFVKLYANYCTSSDTVKWGKIHGVTYTESIKCGLNYAGLNK